MNKADLLKIIIAAVAGVVIKEILTWLLKRTRSIGSSGIAWLKSHPRYIGLAIEAAILIFSFWVLLFGGDEFEASNARRCASDSGVCCGIFFAAGTVWTTHS
jgi:hypothetical protein